jgi:predicted nucleotidyltransferase component of viral defense system
MNKVLQYQRQTLKALSGKIDNFYLAGGTALSLFYFQHRPSIDLDFFTQDFDYSEVSRVISDLESALQKNISLVGRNPEGKTAGMAVYKINFTKTESLKIDFVEDTVELLKNTKVVDGIRVLSLEDIYLRKIYALVGMVRTTDDAGRDKFIGGRADAKDFYDVYILSHTFMPLSSFTVKFCNKVVMEAIVRWFRTYDRMNMIDGALTLTTDKTIDCKAMDRHFKKEIDHILEYELGDI